jgi:hypothetical protein
MSERWRNDYDLWKLATPEDEARECATCGEWMRFSRRLRWHCEQCDERDADWLRDEQEERRRMENEP